MKPWEILTQALRALAVNKLRSALTVLGIMVGIFSVISVMTFIESARTSLERGLSQLGVNSFQISKYPMLSFVNPWQRFGNRRDLTLPMAERLRQALGPEVRVCVQASEGNLVASNGDAHTNPNTSMIGTDEHYLEMFRYTVERGRNLGPEDLSLGRPVCLLGADVARKLYGESDPVGQTLRMAGQVFEVIGLLEAKGASLGQSQDNLILLPITRWLVLKGGQGRSLSVTVQAPDAESFLRVQDQAIGALRVIRGRAPEDENDFEISSNDTLIATMNDLMRVVAVASLAISGVALAAAGVGVMNIMLVSVTERTKEIGIRKSLGARKSSILQQFLLEAVALSLIGGACGVAAGVASGNLVAHHMGTTALFPWFWASVGLAVCGTVGVVFGLYPAWKAASLDPIEALRHE